MKTIKTLIAAALIAGSMTATAEEAAADQSQMCPMLGNQAETIMKARQNGVPMSDLMALVSKHFSGDGIMANFSKQMVVAAYKVPQYNGAKYKASAAHDLRTEWELMCYQSES